MVSCKVICSVVCLIMLVQFNETSSSPAESAFRAMKKIYNVCESSNELFKCMKIQALKLTDRALKVSNIKLMEGLSIVKKSDATEFDARSMSLNDASDNEIMSLPTDKIDEMIADRVSKFTGSYQLNLNVPRMISSEETPRLVEEGRKKMKKYLGPFMAAMAIKGGILTMVYHSIAIVAGKALIIGKIALVISAIIGLKKLVTPEGHEKTTYEIVKHPHVQNSHTYSSSSHGDYEGHESGGQYHRSLADNDNDMLMQDRAYGGYNKKH